jgi:integrase
MPSLFKSKTVAYRDGEGRKVPRGTPGARKVTLVSKSWYGRYKDEKGDTRTVPLCPDKRASKEMLAKLVSDARTRQLYPEPPVSEAERKLRKHQQRPLLEHLEDFRRYLAAKGNCAEHVQKTYRQARIVLEGCAFKTTADLSPSAVVEFLAGRRRHGEAVPVPEQESFTEKEVAALLGVKPGTVGRMARQRLVSCRGSGRKRVFLRDDVVALAEALRQGIGVSMSNHYLVSIKSFAKWLVKDGRAALNPLAHLERQNVKVDLRRQRRPLPADQFTRLVEAAMGGKEFRGIRGEDRAFLYLLAADTGFRAKELASLTPTSFHLDAPTPTVPVAAAYSKHRREDVQTIRKDVAEVMRHYIAGKPSGQRLWPGSWFKNAAEMLRLDLEAAGIPYADEVGRVFDFHGTRHTFISRLAEGGVHPKMAQTLARHSTITLTMDFYTHLGVHDQTAALEKLPPLPPVTSPKDGPIEEKDQASGAA